LTVGTTAVQAYAQLPKYTYYYLRIFNLHSTNVLWCSRAGVPAAVGAPHSFPIGPGLYEVWAYPGPVPVNALSVVATGSDTPVTIEVG
jgi:hypothetical protein